jgi:truncated protein, similar to cell wall surface anchor family protein (fragment 2) (fragment)
MADKFDFDLEVNPIETGPKNQNKETGVSANSVHFNAQTSEPAKTQSVDTEISKTESSSVLSDDLINNMADSISEESVENPILAAEITEDIAVFENVEDSEGIEVSGKIEASKNTDTSENTEISENKDHILDEVLRENNYEEPVEDSALDAISDSTSERLSGSTSDSTSDSASDSASDSTHESNSDPASENAEANAEVVTPAKKEKTKAQKFFLSILAALVAAGIALFVYFFFFANVSASTFSKIFHKVSGSDIEFQQFITGDALNTKGESQIQQADLRVSLSRGSTENSAAVHATLNFTMKGDNSPILLGLEGILAQDGKIYLKLDHLKDSLTAVLKGSGKEIDSEMQKSLDDFAMEIENKWQRIDAEEVIAGFSGALGFTLPKVLQSSIAGTLSCVTQNIGKTHNQQSDLMAKLYRDNQFANFTELSSEDSASYAKLSGDLGKLYRITFNDNKLSRFLEAANKASQNTEISKCLSNAYSLAPNSYEEEEQGVLKDKTIKDYDKYIQEVKSTVNVFVGIDTFTGDIRGLIFTTPGQKNSKELDQTHAVMRFKDSKKKEIKVPAESTPIFDSLSKILKLDQFEEIMKKTPLQNPLQNTTDAEKLLKDANLI